MSNQGYGKRRSVIQFGEFRFDATSGKLFKEEEPITIRNKVAQLLAFFIENPDRIISKDELLEALWVNGEYRERSLSQSVLELRKLLGDSASNPKFIRTIPNQGYKWIAEIAPFKQPDSKSANKKLTLLLPLCIVLTLVAAFWLVTGKDKIDFSHQSIKVAVLPFHNATPLDSYDWVEYGLSDMLATDLMLYPDIQVFPPSQIGAHETDISNWSSEEFKRLELDAVVYASVTMKKEGQSIEYTILDKHLARQTGSITKSDLALSMPGIASTILQQLRPEEALNTLAEYDFEVSAMHEYAKGQQALSQRGCLLAQHYFAASSIIDASHEWSALQRAICMVDVGERLSAQPKLEYLLERSQDPIVLSLSHLWLAEIHMRTGHLDKALWHVTQSNYGETIQSNYSWFVQALKTEYYVQYLSGNISVQDNKEKGLTISFEDVPSWHIFRDTNFTDVNVPPSESVGFPQKVRSRLALVRSGELDTTTIIMALNEALEMNTMVGSQRSEKEIQLETLYWLERSNQKLKAQEVIKVLRAELLSKPDYLVQRELEHILNLFEH
ncbi:winged helix-turn-helix domain-containing protein [Vibrio nigripulchritudo]|uniref:winged helix-turn-helix domain-containing protein n=1 Tax=Vibrio nigripulchritudo TaxID=28173 RepID=UPI0003B19EF0|nr:winged helix-turn-helix domain-containing protein [Vibrio nigripulchritudo]CCN73353.1 putative Effector domain of response regulator protein [Vibrio nigripulchritudo SFn118]